MDVQAKRYSAGTCFGYASCTVEEDENASVVKTDVEDERVDWRWAMIRKQIGSLIREKKATTTDLV